MGRARVRDLGRVTDQWRGAGRVRAGVGSGNETVGRRRGAGQWRGQSEGIRCLVVFKGSSDQIHATIIDNVINHGLSMREAGERVQPILGEGGSSSMLIKSLPLLDWSLLIML